MHGTSIEPVTAHRRTVERRKVLHSTRRHGNVGRGLLFGVLLLTALAAQVTLQRTFAAVNHPVALAAANAESDPQTVRAWYAQLMDQGTYLQMVRTESVDLLWAVALGAAVVALYRFIAGMVQSVDEPISMLLFRLAPLAALGPACDLLENAFSLGMLTDPDGFPGWWPAAQTVLHWTKLSLAVASALVGVGLAVIALFRRRTAAEAPA